MSAATPDRLLGTLIDGRYRVDRAVGVGGFGKVYAALHLGLSAPVALKVLSLGERVTPDQMQRRIGALLDEARTLKRLNHPNIVAALDVGLLPMDERGARLPYLAMEWCAGPTLKELLAQRAGRPMALDEAWRLFEPLLDAVAYAHGEGVAHRDLKPGNVILEVLRGGGFRPRVIDFGIAKLVSPDEAAGSGATRTGSGSSPFTPRYAAPEQLAGARTGPWTDVHALALVFVEMVTGRPAVGDDEDARLAAVDPARPTPRARGIDVGAFEPVIARALALRPADRYADAAALASAMRAAAAVSLAFAPGSRVDLAPRAPAAQAPFPGAGPATERTAPPSSHTLRTGSGGRSATGDSAASRAQRSPRRWIIPVLGALATLAGLGVGVDRYVGGWPFHRRLRDLPTEELGRRAEALALGKCAPQASPNMFIVGCEKGIVELVMLIEPPGSPPDAGRVSANDMAMALAITYGAARFAIDGKMALIVATPPDRVAKDLDRMLEGVLVDVRADAVERPAPAISDAARRALSAWTGADLWAAAAHAGMHVVPMSVSADPAMISILDGDKRATLMLYHKGGQAQLTTFEATAAGPIGYAIDGESVVILIGDARLVSEAFLRRLLGGAHAGKVGVYNATR